MRLAAILTAGVILTLSGCESEALPQAAMPTFSPAAGPYPSDQPVAVRCPTSDAEIRYTTDGTPPAGSSILWTGPILVAGNGVKSTIRAIAIEASGEVKLSVEADHSQNDSLTAQGGQLCGSASPRRARTPRGKMSAPWGQGRYGERRRKP
jgi:hypothetical protein